MSAEDEDGRPLAIYDGNGGMKAVLDDCREVAGFRTEGGGFIFILTSHGKSTRIAMSAEAFVAMADIANALMGGDAESLPRNNEVTA